jgi:manganese transport system ATP-binding protein
MPSAVSAQNLTIGHDASVLVNVSFEIPEGSLTAIIGPNGSGKSTLLHALVGLLPPRTGSLQVLGRSPSQARSMVSYVLQNMAVPPGTPLSVRETVTMGRYSTTGIFRFLRASDRDRVRRAMEEMDLLDLAGRHLNELSGGQRQRAFVAQGLAQDHHILLMDEPLTGLDLPSAQTIDRIIHAETERGCTVILTTHDLDEARAADHVLLLGQGGLLSGPPAQVLTLDHLQQAYRLGAHHPIGDEAALLPSPHHDHDEHVHE